MGSNMFDPFEAKDPGMQNGVPAGFFDKVERHREQHFFRQLHAKPESKPAPPGLREYLTSLSIFAAFGLFLFFIVV
jgi:hypothetical protein